MPKFGVEEMSEDIGFIFDWDGVVVDSSAQHAKSWDYLSEEEGLPLFEGHFKIGFGKRNEFIIPQVLKWSNDPVEVQRLADKKEALYREIVRETGLSPLPGVRSFVTKLEELGFPRVVGSSTPRANIDAVMEIIGLTGKFAGIVAAEDVTEGKPNPEVFLKAAKMISRDPARCIVFEDSFGGIEAGKAAGMKVIGLATTNSLEALREAGVSLAVSSFEELDLKTLLALLD